MSLVCVGLIGPCLLELLVYNTYVHIYIKHNTHFSLLTTTIVCNYRSTPAHDGNMTHLIWLTPPIAATLCIFMPQIIRFFHRLYLVKIDLDLD